DNLKIIFDKTTKTKCSVSIKVPQSGTVNANDTVENLCRDTDHSTRDTDTYKSINHTIIGNSGFTFILHQVQARDEDNFHYINTNISQTSNYQNTSKQAYSNGKLPYESELIYPIVPIHRTCNDDYRIWGFICIDCDKPYQFRVKYEKAIVEGVADGLHDIMMARHSFKTQ
ncbi:MAG: hypothetical protein JNM41_16325, partial [Flavipsychrobacter sp.]|nr:hypothetical protein [Flavipsychrobacter sp.]